MSATLSNQQLLDTLEATLRRLKENPLDGCGYDGTRTPDSCTCAEHDCICHSLGFKEVHGTITDPRYQAAWELVTEHPRKHLPRSLHNWPDGAVCGLLEQVVDVLELRGALMREYGTAVTEGTRFHWEDDAESLFQALMEALNVPPE